MNHKPPPALYTRAKLIGDCHATSAEWSAIRASMHETLVHHPGALGHYPDLGIHMRAAGYVFAFGKRPFSIVIPAQPGPEYPKADGMPQMMFMKPRIAAEADLMYAMMERFKLVIQICKETGNAKVLPATVTANDIYDLYIARGATAVTRAKVAALAVQVGTPEDLDNLLKNPSGYPRLGNAS
jgi:hypothetical protein